MTNAKVNKLTNVTEADIERFINELWPSVEIRINEKVLEEVTKKREEDDKTRKESLIIKSEQIDKLLTSLSEAQGDMQSVKKSKHNAHRKYNYADINSVIKAAHESLPRYKLSFQQHIVTNQDGKTFMVNFLGHSTGQYMESKVMIPFYEDMQKTGSVVTYMRRYTMVSILGLPMEDDDGEAASGVTYSEPVQEAPKSQKSLHIGETKSPPIVTITREQSDELEHYLKQEPEYYKSVLATYKISNLNQLPANKFDLVMSIFQAKEDGG